MLVTIRYGPYEMHGIIRHKMQRLCGILQGLQEHRLAYYVLEISKLNHFEVEMCDRVIASCDIRYLKFNIPYEFDPVCHRILNIILEFAQRVQQQRTSFAADNSIALGSSDDNVDQDDSNSSNVLITDFDDETKNWVFTVPPNTQGDTLSPSFNCNAGSLISVKTEDIYNVQENTDESTPDLQSALSFDPSYYYTLCHNSICDLHLRQSAAKKSQTLDTRRTLSYSGLRNDNSRRLRLTNHISSPEISKCPKSSTSCSSINEEDYE